MTRMRFEPGFPGRVGFELTVRPNRIYSLSLENPEEAMPTDGSVRYNLTAFHSNKGFYLSKV
jgi:hypothetical protein